MILSDPAFTPTAIGFVDIAPGDAGFWTSGCGEWSHDLAPRVMSGEPFGDGTYLVGPEVAPGRYRATSTDFQCFWLRLSDFGMSEDGAGVIAAARYGHTIVDIAATDLAFHSGSCGTWSDDLTPLVSPGEPFGDGTFLVGPEVAPGRYRAASDARWCEWQRLSGFGGPRAGAAIESGGAVEGQDTTAQVEPTDVGFYSINCDTWTPIPP